MQWRHLKNSPAGARRALGHLENAYLQHHRQGLDHKHTADHQQHEFLFRQHGHRPNRAADCQAANIPHKNFRRRRVVPEETETGSGHGAAKDRQLRRFGRCVRFQITRPTRVAAQISQCRQRRHSDEGHADRQSIQSIRQVHRV